MFQKFVLAAGLSAMVLSGCASKEEKNTAKGMGIGGATGAVVGGVLGQRAGSRTRGAILGAAAGAALGGVIGNRMDKQAKELEQVAETKRTDEGLVAELKNDILFDTGKATLKPAAKEDLKQMAEIMKKYPENVLTVHGYTDNTGTSKINEELSEKRAESVKNTLVAYGLPANTITTEGWGPAKPVADNDTAKGRQQNRRVEIEVTADPSKVPQQQR